MSGIYFPGARMPLSCAHCKYRGWCAVWKENDLPAHIRSKNCPLVEVTDHMNEYTVFVKQKSVGELILQNLLSKETEEFYNNCSFASDRMAFLQGMNYAALLCSAKLEQYPATIYREAEEALHE